MTWGWLLFHIRHLWIRSNCAFLNWTVIRLRWEGTQAKYWWIRVQKVTISLQLSLAGMKIQTQFSIAEETHHRNIRKFLSENFSLNILCIVKLLTTTNAGHHETSCILFTWNSRLSQLLQTLLNPFRGFSVMNHGNGFHITRYCETHNTCIPYFIVHHQEWFNKSTNYYHIWFIIFINVANLNQPQSYKLFSKCY